MPTNPVSPNTEAAIDRLALGIDSPRGSEPSHSTQCPVVWPACFEAEASTPAGTQLSTCSWCAA